MYETIIIPTYWNLRKFKDLKEYFQTWNVEYMYANKLSHDTLPALAKGSIELLL